MKLNKRSGATIAAAAAALMVSGGVAGTAMAASHGGKAAMVHCVGVNACKGNSSCATASSACKGQNACKGKGFVSMSEEACKAIGGKVEKKS